MPEHENLASALVAALADLTVVEKDQTAKVKMKEGGTYTYSYTDLGSIVKRTRAALSDHALVLFQPIVGHEQGLAVHTYIVHGPTNDREDFGELPFPQGRDAQATGSWVTYMRRYALLAALGMATGEDDDGAAAAPRQEPEDPTPGLRTSIKAAIEKMDDPGKSKLKDWMRQENLGAVGRLNAEQCQRVLDHILEEPF
jgi:hypothetical protein